MASNTSKKAPAKKASKAWRRPAKPAAADPHEAANGEATAPIDDAQMAAAGATAAELAAAAGGSTSTSFGYGDADCSASSPEDDLRRARAAAHRNRLDELDVTERAARVDLILAEADRVADSSSLARASRFESHCAGFMKVAFGLAALLVAAHISGFGQ